MRTNIKTLEDLRNLFKELGVDNVHKEENMTRKKLTSEQHEIILQHNILDSTLTIYNNGYIMYENNTYYTIFTLDYVHFEYKSVTKKTYSIPEEEYSNDVIKALATFGEIRLAKNSYARSRKPFEVDIQEQSYNKNIASQDVADYVINKLEHDANIQNLIDAILTLTAKQKKAINLYYFEELTQDNIAKKLNCSRTNIESHLQGALKKLKKKLNKK